MNLDGRMQGVRSLTRSFRYAFRGVWFCIRTGRNMRIHLVTAAYVIVFSNFFGLSPAEYAVLLLAVGLVITAEAINTAVEEIVNLHTQHYDNLARLAKDIAAGAVLICAIFAVAIGFILFYRPEKLREIVNILSTNLFGSIVFLVSLPVSVAFIFCFPFKTNRRRYKNGR